MKLSICVITMNRARQLQEALLSCLACELPQETEFVVIDNASTDNTEQVVKEALTACGYSYYYEKLPNNLGVGGGRNYAYEKACGEFAYMLDDDAVIDVEKNADFFVRAISYMDNNPRIATLTSQIYDTAWKRDRVESGGPVFTKGLYKCLVFCGGSHFLRKAFYTEAPYLSNKYGFEEIPPSLRAMNAGMVNVFCPDLFIIHKPAVNKWNYDDEKNHALLIAGVALPYAIKKMMYPVAAEPFLKLAKMQRIKKYMIGVPNAPRKVNDVAKRMCAEYPIKEKIKLGTFLRMYRDFKLSIF